MSNTFRLSDYFAVVSCTLPLEVENNSSKPVPVENVSFKSSVVDRYPTKDYNKECVIPLNFPMFCFPSGLKFKKKLQKPTFHVFVLTLVDGTHVYCAILTIYERLDDGLLQSIKEMPNISVEPSVVLYRPSSLCIISHWPLYSQYAQFLVQLYDMTVHGSPVPVERWVQHFVTSVPLPPAGKLSVQFKISSSSSSSSGNDTKNDHSKVIDKTRASMNVNDQFKSSIVFVRPTINSLPLADIPFELLFRVLDIQNIVTLWHAILVEFKVVLHSKHTALLGVVCEAITTLIYPFKWFHIYIPLLPLPLVQYVHCPCPYIIGVNVPNRSDIDIPEEAVVVDLDNNTISMPSPPPPPLPEKQKSKLMKKLKASANIFEPGSIGDDFDFGSYFTKRTAGSNNKQKESKKKDNTHFDEAGVRDAFLQFFVSLLKNYRKALTESEFNLESFLKHHPSSSEDFITLCSQSQGFHQFVNSRKVAGVPAPEIVLFDEYIIQRKNRHNHLAKDKETPFLNDTSHTVVRTFEVPNVDTSNLDKNYFQYPSFPRFSESLYSKNCKDAPQLVDQSTGGFRSQVPNKELTILWDIVNAKASPKSRKSTKSVKLFNRNSKDIGALWSKKYLGKKYDLVMASVIKIQAYHRAKLLRKYFTTIRVASIPLQTSIRGWGASWAYNKQRRSSLFVQSTWRGARLRLEYQEKRKAAIGFQTQIRGCLERNSFDRIRAATLLLQTHIRRAADRLAFQAQIRAATALQTSFRINKEYSYKKALERSALQLQTHIRGALQALRFKTYKQKVVIAQSVVRRHKVKKQVATMLEAQFIEVKVRLLALWNSMQVPKLHRAFCLVVHDTVTISNLFILLEDEKYVQGLPTPSKAQSKALHEEQQQLYNALQTYNPEGGINQMYIKWGVDSTGKERKQHMCAKLFEEGNTLPQAKESAELLCRVAGVKRQSEQYKATTHSHFLQEVEQAKQTLAQSHNPSRGCCVVM